MALLDDDGTISRSYDPETNEVTFNVPEIPSDADIADVIAALVEIGLITVAA